MRSIFFPETRYKRGKPGLGSKKHFRDILSEQSKKLEKYGHVKKITVSELRVMITKWVAEAWREVSSDQKFMIDTFRKTGLSLAIDGSEDSEMSFADVGEIVVPQ